MRGELLAPVDEQDFALAVKADALLLQIASDAGGGFAATEAEVSRLRLGLEGSTEFIVGDGSWLAPFVESGVRYDGGDAETGRGVEIGGGLRYARP